MENNKDAGSPGKNNDAESGNDGSTNQMLQYEKLIDPGNEHNHHFDADVTPSTKFEADAGGDGNGSVGKEPGEGENEAPDTSGEDG
ncbi:MAG: hypothetical protein ABJA57_05690 [Ginsengibacter sp.]